jgi:predicted lipoprotein with Yx(FWY)xxD motif
MKQNLGAGLAVLALSAALAACGGGTGTAPATTGPAATAGPPAASATASTAVDLKTASSTAGNIVVDAKGMSVYFFTKDAKDSGTSACTDACLAAWPPVTTTSEQPSADGVTGTLGTIPTPDGKKQVTLEGLPLYYFAQDSKPGDILGQGVSNVWYLADPSGAMVKGRGGAAY